MSGCFLPFRLLLLLLLLLLYFKEIPVFNSNSVDPDQTPRSAAFDLGLHYLPVPYVFGINGVDKIMYVAWRASRCVGFDTRLEARHQVYAPTLSY